MGSFLSRALLLILGYTYPAYECFKAIENNKPEIDHLLFWCQYWMLVAVFTIVERVGDAFFSWLPIYSGAKLAFFIYLWHPKTKGTTYIYNIFLKSYIAKHETEFDRNLSKLRVKCKGICSVVWINAAYYGKTRIAEVLQYFISQSASKPHSDQDSLSAGELLSDQHQLITGQPEEVKDCFPASEPSEVIATTTNEKVIYGQVTRAGVEKTIAIEEPLTASLATASLDCSNKGIVTRKLTRQRRGRWRIFRNR